MTVNPEGLLRLLALERLGEDEFIIDTHHDGLDRTFGGEVAAQSLRAACFTVDAARTPHSLHAYFIRPGQPGEPLRIEVRRTRDGRSFSTRHVTAAQGGKPIFEMIASFHVTEPGHEWQQDLPEGIPGPDEIGVPGFAPPFGAVRLFDIRPLRKAAPDEFPLTFPFWVRSRQPLGDDPAIHSCALAFLTDFALVDGAMAPGTPRAYAAAASLDHAVWFHRPVRADEWLLYTVDPASNFGARGLARGMLHTADGVLVASVAQEALLRPAAPPT